MRSEIRDFSRAVDEEVALFRALPADSIHELAKKLKWSRQKVHNAIFRLRQRALNDMDPVFTIAPCKRGRGSGRYFALMIDRSGKVEKITAEDSGSAREGALGTLGESQSKLETLRLALSILNQDAPSVHERRMFGEVSADMGIVIKKIAKLIGLAA
jgi:hypothetical protein